MGWIELNRVGWEETVFAFKLCIYAKRNCLKFFCLLAAHLLQCQSSLCLLAAHFLQCQSSLCLLAAHLLPCRSSLCLLAAHLLQCRSSLCLHPGSRLLLLYTPHKQLQMWTTPMTLYFWQIYPPKPKRAAVSIGLHVNTDKTEYMCFNQTGDISILNASSLKLVDKFTYLWSSVSSTVEIY